MRSRQPVRITLEPERVGRAQVRMELLEAARVSENVDVGAGGNAAVETAVGTHLEVLLEVVADVHVPAALALHPCVGRYLETLPRRRA